MTVWQLLTSNWNWEPWVLVLCASSILIYITFIRFRFTKTTFSFMVGIVLLFLTLVSPISMLSHNYLFSAHMLQHILLLLIVPLLLLIGIPHWLARRALSWSGFGNVIRVLKKPLVAWLFGIGAMWVWHIPSLYNAALRNEGFHIAQQFSLLLMGTVFWLPVFAPLEEWRLPPPFATLYLFSACIACTTLGIIITFAGVGLYSAHLSPADTHGILPFLRNELYLTPKVDQQIGGLIMWVPCCLIYLLASMITIARWYKMPEADVIPPIPVSGSSARASTSIDQA
jgi:putative membrane protein